jgi:hypothetical protein
MLKINDLITSGESFSVRRPKRRSDFYESASIIVQGKELDSRWDTFNLTKYMAFAEAGPNGPYGKNNIGNSKEAFEGSDQKTTKEKPTGIWAKAKTLAKNTWEWIKRVFNNFRKWLAKLWGDLKKWANKLSKKKKNEPKSEEAKKAETTVEKATEDIKEAASNLNEETAKQATTTVEEVIEVLKKEDPKTVVEVIVESEELVTSAIKMADIVIETADNVIKNPEAPKAEEKVKAVKDLGTSLMSLQALINKSIADATNRAGRSFDFKDSKYNPEANKAPKNREEKRSKKK